MVRSHAPVAPSATQQAQLTAATRVLRRVPYYLGRTVLWLVIAGMLVPYVFMITTSLKPARFPTAIPPQWIFEPTLMHYVNIFKRQAFGDLMLHSAIVALSTTVLAIMLALPAAYGLARFRFRGRRFLGLWILSTIMAPPVVSVIPIFILAGRLQLMDTYPVLVIPYTVGNLPMVIMLLRSTILQLPHEIEEAALVDGCSRIGILFRIVIPLCASGIATAAMLTIIACWNEFLFASALTRKDVLTAPVGVMNFSGQFGTDWGSITAAATTVVAPILAMALVLRRRFVSGLTAGAVK